MGMTPVDPAETDRSHAAAHDARATGKREPAPRFVAPRSERGELFERHYERVIIEMERFMNDEIVPWLARNK